jgi:enoyl-CoA hydratase/carnithine racemase
MHCDVLVAGRKSKLGQPEINIGISPGSGGVQRVARAMGKFRAMRWLLTGEIMNGEKAFELGLVSDVVDDDKVLDRALEYARAIATLPALGEVGSKEAILSGMDAALEAGLLLENRAFQLLFSSEDRKEGMSAFLERRAPVFKGR